MIELLFDALRLLGFVLKWSLFLAGMALALTGLCGAIYINLIGHPGIKVRSAEWLPYEDAKAQMRVRDYAPRDHSTPQLPEPE